MNESVQGSNIAESDMGQLHSIHLAENAVARVQASMPQGPSRWDCVDCGDKIPEQRRQAAKGCSRCILCQGMYEQF
jgi:phage/conjugal plasmid C-4 type zinc finger TraR family protein